VNPSTCPHCGADIPATPARALCPQCGKELRAQSGGPQRPAERTCPNCNYVLAPFENACPRCGTKVAAAQEKDAGVFRPVQAEPDEAETAPAGPPQMAAGPPRIADESPRRPGPRMLDDEGTDTVQRPWVPPPPASSPGPSEGLRPVGGARPTGKSRPAPGGLQPLGAARAPSATPDSPWGTPPPASRDVRLIERNTSGTRSGAPREILGWNWGAFFLNWIWGIGNNVWIAFLTWVPVFGFIWCFVLGAKGSEWAWQHRRFKSVAEFRQVQRAWAIAGLIVFLVLLAGNVIAVVLAGITFATFMEHLRSLPGNPLGGSSP